MKPLQLPDVVQYVEQNIESFHTRRIQSLESLKLGKIIKRKNPYLFKAKNILTSEEIVRGLLDAHLSSNEETIFGDWLEELAIYINSLVFGGWKSGIPGIDLEFDANGVRNIVTIKSGPNWGNSSQIKKMQEDFKTAIKTLRTSHSKIQVKAVNGCCYGQDSKPDKGNYFKYCGQDFWDFISGNIDLYLDIIEPLGHQAKEKNDKYYEAYASVINQFTKEFSNTFCLDNGQIDWNAIVMLNSSSNSITKG
jgi:hypothetical protein